MPTDKKTHEHSARLHAPGKYVSFATGEDKGGKGVNFVYGIRKKEGPEGGKSEIQAVRFDSNLWTAAEAKKWLKDHDMSYTSFHAATIKEDGAPAAPASSGGAPATTTSNMGATYAPKVMPMTSHYGEFGVDKYDQHFMKKMRKKLNEGVEEGKNGYVGFYKGKRFEVMANSSFEAQKKIAADNKIKDRHNITVVLATKDGEQVTHVATEAAEYYPGIDKEQTEVIEDMPQVEINIFEKALKSLGGNINKALKIVVDSSKEAGRKISYGLFQYADKNGWSHGDYAMEEEGVRNESAPAGYKHLKDYKGFRIVKDASDAIRVIAPGGREFIVSAEGDGVKAAEEYIDKIFGPSKPVNTAGHTELGLKKESFMAHMLGEKNKADLHSFVNDWKKEGYAVAIVDKDGIVQIPNYDPMDHSDNPSLSDSNNGATIRSGEYKGGKAILHSGHLKQGENFKKGTVTEADKKHPCRFCGRTFDVKEDERGWACQVCNAKISRGFPQTVKYPESVKKPVTEARAIKYRGYTIEPSGDNFYIKDSKGHRAFGEVPASVATAKKWIDQEIAEKGIKESVVTEALNLTDKEKKAIDVLKKHPDNKVVLDKKSEKGLIDTYLDLCEKNICRWHLNDNGTIEFTLE